MDLEELVIVDDDSSMSVEFPHPRPLQPMSASQEQLTTQCIVRKKGFMPAALGSQNEQYESPNQQSTFLPHPATNAIEFTQHRQSKTFTPAKHEIVKRQGPEPFTPRHPTELAHRTADGFVEHKHSVVSLPPPVSDDLRLTSMVTNFI